MTNVKANKDHTSARRSAAPPWRSFLMTLASRPSSVSHARSAATSKSSTVFFSCWTRLAYKYFCVIKAIFKSCNWEKLKWENNTSFIELSMGLGWFVCDCAIFIYVYNVSKSRHKRIILCKFLTRNLTLSYQKNPKSQDSYILRQCVLAA